MRTRRLLPTLGLALCLFACGGRPAAVEDASCSGPLQPTQPLRCFQDCTRDEDCVGVWPNEPCVCVPWMVNRAFRTIVEEKARIEADRVVPRDSALVGCGCWGCLREPVCGEGVCSVRYRCTREVPDGG